MGSNNIQNYIVLEHLGRRFKKEEAEFSFNCSRQSASHLVIPLSTIRELGSHNLFNIQQNAPYIKLAINMLHQTVYLTGQISSVSPREQRKRVNSINFLEKTIDRIRLRD